MSNPFLNIDRKFSLNPLPPANQPIFVLSTIWRSGSTLFQRTLCTDHDILIWGEPYADCNLFTSLSRSALALTQENWPHAGHFAAGLDHVFDAPEEHFIANLYPAIGYFRRGQRQLLDTTFAVPAKQRGRERFGIKFVRLSLEEANYLHWIYPDAKFIFLVRNPWDCWRSYKGYSWNYRWPKQTISKVSQFAMLWNKQTTELLKFSGHNKLWLRYEDFLQPDFDWDGLREFCELPNITRKALDHKISGVNTKPQPIDDSDILAINKICSPLALQLGYTGLKQTDLRFRWP